MMNILSGIDSTSSALNAERIRMDVVSQNIANVNTTRGPNGKPYARHQVVFEAVLNSQLHPGQTGAPGSQPVEVRVPRIETDSRPPRLVYQPGHPHADANGMVTMPNINMYEEMVDLMSASRAYEANLSVVKTARSMALHTLGIGRR
jgi:flagellar basal-body rod protein FlgC